MPDLKAGTIIDRRFRVVGRLGAGGMGTVYHVIEVDTEDPYALKLCHLTDDEALRRFAREVRILRHVSHPNVIPIGRVGVTHDPPYFTMPLAEGSCSECISIYAANEAKALGAFVQICEGIQAIHAAGAVHRDIKPHNALLYEGRIVVSDFGLSKMDSRDTTVLTQTNIVFGTAVYLAPEQWGPAGTRNADVRTDVYQLGKTLYQFLTGLEPGLIDLTRIPAGLRHVVRRATDPQPAARYQTVAGFIDAINAYRRSQDPNANPVEAFQAALDAVRDRLAAGQYRGEDLRRLLGILNNDMRQAEAQQFLRVFDDVPVQLLPILAQDYEAEFDPVIEHYVKSLDEAIGDRDFAYAETVARRMSALVNSDDTPPVIKAKAVEATLVAAVELNRFAAMDVLAGMLRSTQDGADAAEVAGMLDRRRRQYARVCDQVPSINLHPQIRVIRDQLAGEQRR